MSCLTHNAGSPSLSNSTLPFLRKGIAHGDATVTDPSIFCSVKSLRVVVPCNMLIRRLGGSHLPQRKRYNTLDGLPKLPYLLLMTDFQLFEPVAKERWHSAHTLIGALLIVVGRVAPPTQSSFFTSDTQ